MEVLTNTDKADGLHPITTLKSSTLQVTTDTATTTTTLTLIFQEFQDKYMVLITESGKIGTWIHITRDTNQRGGDIFDVQTLLGIRDDVHLDIIARQVGQLFVQANGRTYKPILLGVMIKKSHLENAVVKQIVQAVSDLIRVNPGGSA